jgi:hypothetical protein
MLLSTCGTQRKGVGFSHFDAEGSMIREYIDMALQCAHYEMIQDEEPYFGEVKELR